MNSVKKIGIFFSSNFFGLVAYKKPSTLVVLPIWACYAATWTQHDDALRQPRNQAYARLQFRDLALFNSFSKSIRRTRQHLILSK